MKATTLTIFLSLAVASSAVAQGTIKISDLLAQGYDIVAAAGRGEGASASVFLQKGTRAFMCRTSAQSSRCWSMNK